MKRYYLTIAAAMLCVSAIWGAQTPAAADSVAAAKPDLAWNGGKRPEVGLVLSGGGAKGIAHIGFIAALEQDSIPIDCITGTSMGAIVGSLYAAGYSPREMMELIASPDFQHWSSGQISQSERLSYVSPEPSSQWLSVNLGPGHSLTDVLPTRLINPLPMSWAFMQLYAPVTGACDGDFDRLMVPLRTVASDVSNHRPVVFSHGELADAVRASMSFPMVFQPIEVDGNLLYDGGLYDVYPVNVMVEDFDPQHVIGLNVSSPNSKPKLNSLLSQVENMIMNDETTPFPPDGVNVRFHLDRFSLLDWGAADTIYAIGYRRAQEMIDTIKRVIPYRISPEEVARRRAAFREQWRTVRFDSITINGTTVPKERYIYYLMAEPLQGTSPMAFRSPRQGSELPPATMPQARRGFYDVASTGRVRNLVPHAVFNDSTGLYRLVLDADVDSDYKCAVGGYLTSSAGSFLYAAGMYDPFELKRIGWGIELWAGHNYLAGRAESCVKLNTVVPSQLILALEGTRGKEYEGDHAFYDFGTPSFLTKDELWLELAYRLMAGQHGVFELKAAAARMVTRYHTIVAPMTELATRRRFDQDLGVISAKYTLNTLNDAFAPTQGTELTVGAIAMMGPRHLEGGEGWQRMLSSNGVWANFEASLRHYMPIGRHFSLGVEATAFWSAKPLMRDNYECAIINTGAFVPVESGRFLFDPQMRANQYATVGLVPVWRISSIINTSLSGWLYAPMRRIICTPEGGADYSGWFDRVEGLARLSVNIRLPIAALQAYVDWRSKPTQRWGGGVSFGIPIYAPRLAR